MSISDAVIGSGDLIISTEGNTFPFRFDIRQSGIRCYNKPNGTDFTSLFDVLKRSTFTTIRPGSHLVLDGLPASPADAFRSLALSYTPDAFTLTVVNADAFSPRLNYGLKDLHLDFSFRISARRCALAIEYGRPAESSGGNRVPLPAAWCPAGVRHRYASCVSGDRAGVQLRERE